MEILTCPLDSKGPSIENNLISIEILTYPLGFKGKSIESKLISIEFLTENLMNPIFGFAGHYLGVTTFLVTIWGWQPSHGSRPSGGDYWYELDISSIWEKHIFSCVTCCDPHHLRSSRRRAHGQASTAWRVRRVSSWTTWEAVVWYQRPPPL